MGVLDEIIKKQIECINRGQIDKIAMDAKYDSYCKDPKANLLYEMGEDAKVAYAEGSGAEMKPRGKKPPKMASVRSSSAMTFNLLGNDTVTFHKKLEQINPGAYKVDFEKQMYTLGCEGNPANLDAFLEGEKQAVFCEMKMTEWLSTAHGELADKYELEENYFSKKAYEVFMERIQMLKAETFKRYDAWQMFKHTLAIFNATFLGDADLNKEKHEESLKSLELCGKFDSIVLANVVYQIGEGEIADKRSWHSYERLHEEELEDFRKFKGIMLDDGRLQKLFKEECNASFDICFIPTKDFIDCMEKTEEERTYLERYWKM